MAVTTFRSCSPPLHRFWNKPEIVPCPTLYPTLCFKNTLPGSTLHISRHVCCLQHEIRAEFVLQVNVFGGGESLSMHQQIYTGTHTHTHTHSTRSSPPVFTRAAQRQHICSDPQGWWNNKEMALPAAPEPRDWTYATTYSIAFHHF